MTAPYRLRLTTAARRALTESPPVGIPHSAATAAAEFLTGALLINPRRVGKALGAPLEGHHSARRGEYRVLYRIDEESSVVTVIDIAHRRDVYRGR